MNDPQPQAGFARWPSFRRRKLSAQGRASEVAQFIQFIDVLHVHFSGASESEAALKAGLSGSAAPWARAAMRATRSGGNPWRAISAEACSLSIKESCLILEVGWRETVMHGASLAPVLDHVRSLFRDRLETEALVREETASLVMSARLLTGLPILSVPLGVFIGANPLQWLVETPIGRLVFCIGAALNTASWLATQRILKRATRRDENGESIAATAAALAALAARPDAQALQLAMAVREIAILDTTGTLQTVASTLDVGVSAHHAWQQAAANTSWVPLCEAMSHMARSGVLRPDLLAMISRDAAYEIRARMRERVRRACVLILIPTGLLALPAFMLMTVVPLVAAHFAHMPWLTSR